MRIAIVGTDLCAVDRRGGGLEQVLRRWAVGLQERHEVVVVTRPAAPEPDRFERLEIGRTADLAPALQKIAPDVVSLHNRPQWLTMCPPGAAVTVTFHNYPTAWRVPRWRPARARGAPGRVAFSAVSGALALAGADELGVPGAQVAVTPPSIDPVFLEPRRRTPGQVVLAPNRLLRKKGVLDLLQVARRPEFSAVKFSFADVISPWRRPTEEHRALRAAVRAVPNAELFPAARDARELAERYATSGAVACPVREAEGLGLVALEAQACGVPLVTTDLGGLREATFAPNRCIAPGDPEALAEALATALADRHARTRARSEVVARYSPPASLAVFERFVLGVDRGR